MKARLEYRRYRLPFRAPVRTAHGTWREREGLLVRTVDLSGRVGFGEVAPIPWFGTETLEEAEECLGRLGGMLPHDWDDVVPERLGCVRCALASAVGGAGVPADAGRLPAAALLPAGRSALEAVGRVAGAGYTVFKWKVGVERPEDEWGILDDLLSRLPDAAQMRLDANGAWSSRQAGRWLDRCAERPVEFVEQPVSPEDPDALAGLARDYPTPIALDESVSGLASLNHWLDRGWPGVFVVKPSLSGTPSEVLAALEARRADAVFSTAFETRIGRKAALGVAFRYAGPRRRAVGFGTGSFLRDSRFDAPPAGPFIEAGDIGSLQEEAETWNALS